MRKDAADKHALEIEAAAGLMEAVSKLDFSAEDVKIEGPRVFSDSGKVMVAVYILFNLRMASAYREIQTEVEQYIDDNGFQNDLHPVDVDVRTDGDSELDILGIFFYLRAEENSA